MLIRPAIDDTEPIRYRRPNPDGQFSGNILDEAMRGQYCKPNDSRQIKAAARRAFDLRALRSEAGINRVRSESLRRRMPLQAQAVAAQF
jgi:hypothetical protein